MLDPKHLLWLAEIAELGSLSRAARKLHVTQPTLTRAVQVIEDHVGSKVLQRERRGVRPTKIGERLVEIGRGIIENRSRAEDIVDLWREGLDRELRVGVGPMLAASIMGRFFAGLIDDQPRYALRVVSATASGLIERLNGGALDIAVAPEQISLFQEDLVQHKLLSDDLAIFAGRKNPLAQQARKVLSHELEDRTWIAIGAHSGIFGSTKEVLGRLNVRRVTATVSFTGDINMAAEILQRTSALCVMPRRLAGLSGILDGVAPIDFEGQMPTRDIVLWSRRSDYDRPDIQDFHRRLAGFVAREKLA